MKLLIKDRARLSTVSAVSANPNYPAENLKSKFLKKRFQSSAASDTITFDAGSNVLMDCLFYGWTNADSITITLKNAAMSTLYTVTRAIVREASDPFTSYEVQYDNTDSFFFTEVSVRYVIVDISTSEPDVFMGGIGFGVMNELQDVSSGWKRSFDDNSSIVESVGGQITQNYVRPIALFEFDVPTLTVDMWNYWQRLYLDIAKGNTIWADFFDRDHDYQKPVFCSMINPVSPGKTGIRYSIKFNFKEAR